MDLRTPTTERRNGVKQKGPTRLIPGSETKRKGQLARLKTYNKMSKNFTDWWWGEGVLEGKVLGTLSSTNYSTTSYIDNYANSNFSVMDKQP